MKWKLVFVFSAFVSVLSAQNPILGSFEANIIYNTIRLDWVIVAGSSCNGIDIQRSSDGISFISIGNIEGICGNVSNPVPYNFTDENPILNARNYYRLELGGQGFSQIIDKKIYGLNAKGYNFFPNPVENEVHFVFANPNNDVFEMIIYDIQGKKVLGFKEIYNDDVILQMNSLLPGVYVFRLSDTIGSISYEGKIIKGKLNE